MDAVSEQAGKQTSYSQTAVLEDIREILVQEAQTIANLAHAIPNEIITLVEKIIHGPGRLVLIGMGKSGFIAQKLAATFSSMGTPAFFLHPAEALHGDLGMVKPEDVVVALSKSANTEELSRIIPALQSQGNFVVLWCCHKGGLSTLVDLAIQLPFYKEVDVLNLAPTSSSTMMLAFGDALAMVVSKLRGFSREDFARLHPGGALGKNLVSTAGSFMYRGEDLPLMSPEASFQEVLLTITSKKLGVGIVVDKKCQVQGVITDGDLRRACNCGAAVFTKKAAEIMTSNPKTISPEVRAYTALAYMEDLNITTLIVVEGRCVVGLVHIHDLVKAGILREYHIPHSGE